MRLKILSLIISSMFVILAGILFWMQLVRGGYYYELSQNNRIRLITQAAPRGDILDIKGKLIADSVLSYDLAVRPCGKKEKELIFDRLSRVLGLSAESVSAIYKKNYIGPFADVVLAKNISKELAFKFEQMNFDLPSVGVRTVPHRRYVYNEATSHILGFLGEIDRDELIRLKDYGYRRGNFLGKAGLEKTLDRPLRGEDGGMQIEVNNRGYQAGVLNSKAPIKGEDVRLTIDIDVQEYIYSLLNGKKAAVIVLNPNDGRIIAMASSPSFDPDIFTTSEGAQAVKALFNDKSAPFLNRAIQGQYPPGSILKIVTASAGLDTKKIHPAQTSFYCPGFYLLGGKRFGCWEEKGHGRLDLGGAIEHSCNVFFFKAGEKIRQESLTHYAYIFSLGKATGVDLYGEAKGFVPDKNWKRLTLGENWYDGDTLNFSIGQGYVLMTPLQAVVMVSAIANDGKLTRPYLVESVGGVKAGRPHIQPLPVSHKTIEIIGGALKRVVNSPTGTGVLAGIDGLSVSGKTGTAQLKAQTSHAWFVGYAPSDNPKAAIVVFVENGGYGGEVAAPIASAVFKKMKMLGLL